MKILQQEGRDERERCDSVGSDYCNTACRLCDELFSLDPDAADSCDLCLLPFHTHCLKIVEHPLEDYTVCSGCMLEVEARAYKASDASSEQLDASAAAAVVIPSGWLDLDTEQQATFQSWCQDRMAAKRQVAVKALKHLQDEAEAQGHVVKARAKLNQVQELMSAAEAMGTTEDMRKDAWLFIRSDGQ